MKAILIDPIKHRVSAIEVEYDSLSRAFTNGKSTPVALTLTNLNLGGMLIHDKSQGWRGAWFSLIGSGLAPIYGRGLVLGYARDGKGFRSTEWTVREAEQLVRFGS